MEYEFKGGINGNEEDGYSVFVDDGEESATEENLTLDEAVKRLREWEEVARKAALQKEKENITEFKFYAHSSKDSNWSQAEDLGLSKRASDVFAYCGYEIEFDCALDRATGVVTAHKVNGVELKEPVKLT